MNSLNQYLEIYRLNRDAIDAGSAPLLNRLRPEAFSQLAESRLPEKGEEGYEHTSVNSMMGDNYGLNINRVAIPVDVAASFRCDVPSMSTLMGIVVNDSFVPVRGLESRLPEGVTFTSLRQAALTHPALVEKYYGTLANLSEPAVALNTLFVQDGVFIHIAAGVKLEKTLQLVNIFSAPTSLMAARRVLVVVEEGASAQLLVCDHTQDSATSYLSSEVVELIVEKGARFGYCHIEESSVATTRHSQLFMRQSDEAEVALSGVTLTCGTTRNDYYVDLAGEHCNTRLSGMAIGSGTMHIDNSVVLRHLKPCCKSEQLFKYVLDQQSVGAFGGRILVTPDAAFTDAFQTNRNMLASTEAKMHTKPQLEIYNDEVKCSHGATTGQLDAEALFYMRARGIDESEARNMLMQAFMADVIENIAIEGLSDRLRHLVEKRFQGELADCSACSTCRNEKE